VKAYFDEPYYVGFNIGGYELGLQPDNSKAKKTENVVSYWGVEDIEKVYQNFIKLGATAHDPPTNRGGEMLTAEVKDPFGNIIGLIYNPYFSLKD
jgi:lactoylglutathione lyase